MMRPEPDKEQHRIAAETCIGLDILQGVPIGYSLARLMLTAAQKSAQYQGTQATIEALRALADEIEAGPQV